MQNMLEIKLINASKSTLPLSVSDSSGKCISVQVFRSKVLIEKCRNSKFCLLRRKFYTKKLFLPKFIIDANLQYKRATVNILL